MSSPLHRLELTADWQPDIARPAYSPPYPPYTLSSRDALVAPATWPQGTAPRDLQLSTAAGWLRLTARGKRLARG